MSNGNELIGQVVAHHGEMLDAHSTVLDVLRELHDNQQQQLDAHQEALVAVLDALDGLKAIVARHDDTLRRIHRGLHSTSDPEMYPTGYNEKAWPSGPPPTQAKDEK